MRQVQLTWNVPATLVRMCSARRSSSATSSFERDRIAGELREAEIADRGAEVEQPRDDRGLPGIGGGFLVEPAQPVGEADRKRPADQRAHALAGAAGPRRSGSRISSAQDRARRTTKLNSTSGCCCGIARRQRHLPARERLPQHRPEIGDLRAERAPRRLALQVDDQIGLRAAGQSRTTGGSRRTARCAASRPGARCGRRCAPMNSTGWFCKFCPTPGQVGAHLDAERTQVRRRARCRSASAASATGCRRRTG